MLLAVMVNTINRVAGWRWAGGMQNSVCRSSSPRNHINYGIPFYRLNSNNNVLIAERRYIGTPTYLQREKNSWKTRFVGSYAYAAGLIIYTYGFVFRVKRFRWAGVMRFERVRESEIERERKEIVRVEKREGVRERDTWLLCAAVTRG